jgi:hypothetical protein
LSSTKNPQFCSPSAAEYWRSLTRNLKSLSKTDQSTTISFAVIFFLFIANLVAVNNITTSRRFYFPLHNAAKPTKCIANNSAISPRYMKYLTQQQLLLLL